MPEIIDKPKSRAQQIRELDFNNSVSFTLGEYDYIRSLVSGDIATKHPLRVFTVSKKESNTKVTRLEDAAI